LSRKVTPWSMLVLVLEPEKEKESYILFRELAAPLHSHHSRVAWLEKTTRAATLPPDVCNNNYPAGAQTRE
jgi:hypothetical protein